MAWDLKLIVGPGLVEINAFSQVMSIGSPVFAKMLLSDRFAEGSRLAEHGFLELQLPEDDAVAMQVLVDVFHHESDKVPTALMTQELLAKLATLVDRYDCAKAFNPWSSSWINLLPTGISSTLADTPLPEVIQWLHISCQFGYSELFTRCTSAMVKRTSRADLSDDFEGLKLESLSPSLLDTLKLTRSTCLDGFRQCCIDLEKTLESGKQCRLSEPYGPAVFNCHALQYGGLLLELHKSIGKGWRSAENWSGSVQHHLMQLEYVCNKLKSSWFASSPGTTFTNVDNETIVSPHRRACGAWKKFEPAILTVAHKAGVRLQLADFGNAYHREKSTVLGKHARSDD